ncbi:hypothetical protein G6M89_21710 [Natronolimnobius sp. AArcel1]|uniref:hypothetical protein n=1 Tax=Natronolimnobius sp. AArcel1 TaxID=1679093 RepID=UPI0013EAB1F3|nr:hypothetical protein [Natronolimnobius sp. AArcel1]NGM71564.1 hypothetical protein [Natronolimnobius sp. AArcel1]
MVDDDDIPELERSSSKDTTDHTRTNNEEAEIKDGSVPHGYEDGTDDWDLSDRDYQIPGINNTVYCRGKEHDSEVEMQRIESTNGVFECSVCKSVVRID